MSDPIAPVPAVRVARRPFPPLPDPTRVPPLAVLVGLLVLRLGLLLVAVGGSFAVLNAAGSVAPRDTAVLWSNVWIVPVDLITLAVVAWLLRREGTSWKALLGRFTGRDLAWSVPASLLFVVAFFGATFVGNLVAYGGPPPTSPSNMGPVPLWLGIWAILLMPVTIALAEEVLYRDYLLARVQSRFGQAMGFILVAAGFGLQHLVFAVGDGRAMLSRALALFLVGLAVQAMYVWFRRLWPLVIGHWLLDAVFLGLPLLGLALAR